MDIRDAVSRLKMKIWPVSRESAIREPSGLYIQRSVTKNAKYRLIEDTYVCAIHPHLRSPAIQLRDRLAEVRGTCLMDRDIACLSR